MKLLTGADLLEEGKFSATVSNAYVSWMKKLPSDPTNSTDTLRFQQTKLNTFDVTWQEYELSFKDSTLCRSNRSSFMSTTAAEILQSKPYRDVGFILDESNILTKSKKYI